MSTSAGVIICSLLLFAANDDQNLLKVTTDGSASGPVIESQSKAIERAKDAIIYKILAPYAPTGDFKPFKKIIGRSEDYIYSTRLLESKREDNTTRVKMESYIVNRQLMSDIAAVVIPKMPEPPSCLILVAETMGDQEPDVSKRGIAEFALIEQFRNSKIEIADTEEIRTRYSSEELLAQINAGEDLPAFKIDDGSDVAIIGTCAVTFQGPASNSNVFEATAKLTLRTYDLRTFELGQIYTADASVKGATKADSAKQAVEDTCTRIGNDTLAAAVLTAVSRKPQTRAQMLIHGLDNETQFAAVVESVRKYPGVKDVEPMHWSRLVSRISFEFKDSVNVFTEFVSGARYPGFRLSPHMVVGNELEFEVAKTSK